jgi:hypothetical protein
VSVLEDRHILFGEVVSNDRHHPHRREVASRQSDVTSRATEHPVIFSMRRLNSIERNRPHYQ